MKYQLQKAINLARKTGDRLIVFDSLHSEEPFVVMSMNEYEKIAIGRSEVKDLTEDELLDKINRDIAVWKNEQTEEQNQVKNEMDDDRYFANIKEYTPEMKDAFYDYGKEAEKKNNWGKKGNWNIPRDRKEAAEEIIEEDRQYLENI